MEKSEEVKNTLSSIFPFVSVSKPSFWELDVIYIKLSVDKKEDWKYWYIENSKGAAFRLENDGTFEQFARYGSDFPKIRKSKIKNISDLMKKF